jgi:hypothetical protein
MPKQMLVNITESGISSWETYYVKAINVGLFDPHLEPIGDLGWCANKDGTITPDAYMFGDGVLSPLGSPGGESSIALDGRPASCQFPWLLQNIYSELLDCIALNLPELLVVTVFAQVSASPSTKEGKRTLGRRVFTVFRQLGLGLLRRPPQNGCHQCQHLDVVGITAKLRLCQLPDLGDALGTHSGRMGRHEDGLGVLRGKDLAGLGSTGLEKEWGPLGRGLNDMGTRHREELAIVVDLPHEIRLCVDAFLTVELHCIVSPGGLKELVHDLDIFLGLGISVVMLMELSDK